MKTIQHLTQHEFNTKQVFIGDKIIGVATIIFAFAMLLLPFILLVVRLN